MLEEEEEEEEEKEEEQSGVEGQINDATSCRDAGKNLQKILQPSWMNSERDRRDPEGF